MNPPGVCKGYAIYLPTTGMPRIGEQCVVSTPSNSLTVNKWYGITGTYDGSTFNIYINGALNGQLVTSPANTFSNNGQLYIGRGTDGSFNGKISNVQIYNISLSANEVQALYIGGIGGAPLVLQNLVGWWPLNLDAQDYSGDNINGATSNVVYSSGWTSGYTPP